MEAVMGRKARQIVELEEYAAERERAAETSMALVDELSDQVTALGEDNFMLREALANERQIVECFKFLADRRKEKLRAVQADRSALSEQLLAMTNQFSETRERWKSAACRIALLEKVIEDAAAEQLVTAANRDRWHDLYLRCVAEKFDARLLADLGVDDSPGCTD